MANASYISRTEKLSAKVKKEGLDALLVTYIPNIRYLSNFSGSTAMMLVLRDRSIFFSDFRYTVQASEEISGSEYIEVQRSYLPDVIAKAKELGVKKLGVEKSITLGDFGTVEELAAPDIELVRTAQMVSDFRMIKDSTEVFMIKRSLDTAVRAFNRLLPAIKPGVIEKDLMAELEYLFMKEGGEKASFETIIASGPRGALPHGRASDKRVEKGEFIVIDFGTVLDGYCSDITRTVFVGKPSAEDIKIYNTVLDAQVKALEGITPGMKASDADGIARKHINDAGYAEYFGHGLGHGLGLEVHEGPAVSQKGETVLESGMVFTVEPGIYLPGRLGVRIEDVAHLTVDGCEILTDLTKELIII